MDGRRIKEKDLALTNKGFLVLFNLAKLWPFEPR